MSAHNLDFNEVETFLNSNPDFLGTFLSKNDFNRSLSQRINETAPPTLSMSKCVEKLVNQQRVQKKKIIDATMDENQRFSEFVKDIAGELNVDALSHKIMQNVIYLTGSDRGRLFLVEGLDEKYLVSKLFDVTATSQLDDTIHNEDNAIHIPFGKGIVGTVAESKISMNIKDAYDDPRFDPDVDKLSGYQTRCILCMPILNKEGDVVGVAEIMNKQGVNHFSEQDEILFSEYLNFCGIGINNARLFQMSIEEIQRNQLLLNLAWQISTGQSNIDQIIKAILEHALQIIKCKFASIYLLDTKGQSFSKTYRLNSPKTDVIITNKETEDLYTTIAKKSLKSKERIFMINLSDDPEYIAGEIISSDENKEEKMKTYEEGANWVLCTSIHDPSDACIGSIMFAGKSKAIHNQADTNTVEAFAVYCGLGLYNCQLYQTTVKSLTIKQVLMEILSYHMTSEREEVDRIVHIEMPSANECKLYDFGFNDLVLSDVSTIQASALIFIKMNALNILGISLEHLYHWILTVKKNYKSLLYHNWRHALNVTQTLFCALSKGVLKKYFTPFECICLLVASLCHDLDYQGSSSAKNLKSLSLLATVYSTSSCERVLGRCIMILNADATNIFQNLTTEKYREAMEFIKKAILATDIFVYLVNVKHFDELKKKRAPFHNEHDKDMLTVLTMVSCDLSAFSKPWNNHKILVLAGASELFQTSDSRKDVPVMRKSESHKIPQMMIHFIDTVCLRVFQTMSEFDETFMRLYDSCVQNRKHWDNILQRINEFDLETELNKSQAGFVDFDEPIKRSVSRQVPEKTVSTVKAENAKEENIESGREKSEKKEREELKKGEGDKGKDENDEEITEAEDKDENANNKNGEKEKREKERKEKERREMELVEVGCERERERMRRDLERREKEEKERKQREKEAKEERERLEKEKEEKEKQKKEKEERRAVEKLEREKEMKELQEKEKQEKEKKAREEKERKQKEKEEMERKEKERIEKQEKEEKERKEKKEKEEKEKKEKKEKDEKEKKEKKEKDEKEKKGKKEKEEREGEEKEKAERENKEKEKKEEEEKREKEIQKMKEAERKEAEKKEMPADQDIDRESMQDSVKEQLMARMSDKLINLKSPSGSAHAMLSQDESGSAVEASPMISPKVKGRQKSEEAEEIPVVRRLSYRQPEESTLLPSPKRQLSRRKSYIEEVAEENMRQKVDKQGRRSSLNRSSPVDQVRQSPVRSPPKTQEPFKRRQSSIMKPEEGTLQKRQTIVRSESAKQRIKASTLPTGEKRKCAPRAPEKDYKKKVQKSSFCLII